MEKVMILATPAEIAEGLKKFMADNNNEAPKPAFKEEKMTVGEASQFIDVNYVTLCKWIKEKKIPVHGKGRKRFVLKAELIEAYKNM